MNLMRTPSRFVDWFCARFGIDRDQLRIIFETKSLIQDRWRITGQDGRSAKAFIGPFKLQLLFMMLSGVLASFGLLFDSVVTGMTLSYTVIMMVLGLLFFSYFTSALLDTTDNQVLFSRPVSASTLFAARIIHSAGFVGSVTVSFSLLTLLAVGIKHGILAVLPFLLSLLLLLFFLVMLVQVVFLFAVNFTDPRKFQNLILYFLILISALCMVALSLYVNSFVGMIDFSDIQSTNIEGGWMYYYPPAWLAGLMASAVESPAPLRTSLALLGIFVPLFGLTATTYFFVRRYRTMLARFESVSTDPPLEIWRPRFWPRLRVPGAGSSPPARRAVSSLVGRLMSSDQAFKIRIYPTLGIVLAFLALFIYDKFNFSTEYIETSFAFFFFIYAVSSVMATTVTNLQFGSQYEASWFYRVLPFGSPGEIYRATIDAFILRFILPLNLLVSGLCGLIWGWRLLLDTLFAAIVGVLACIWQCRRMQFLPFSQNILAQPNPLKIILDYYFILLPLIVLASVHAYLKVNVGSVGVATAALCIGVVTLMAYRRLGRLEWRDLKIEQSDHLGWTDKKEMAS